MPSFGELIDQVIGTLHGYTTDTPALGSLIGPIGPTTTEIAIDFGTQPGAARPTGFVEIGSELIAVQSFDPNTGIAHTSPWGRGQRNTVAVSHALGEMVTVRPRYPRKLVADTINQVVKASCPPLYAARDLAPIDTGGLVAMGYDLPLDCTRVLRVDATDRLAMTSADRRVLRSWTVRSIAGTQQLIVPPNEVFETLLVTIAAEPGQLVNPADDFATVTGLPASAADMVVFGAIARLILGIDLARQQVTSVEASQRADRIGVSSGSTISRYFQAMYQQRLDAEQTHLLQTYPPNLLRRG